MLTDIRRRRPRSPSFDVLFPYAAARLEEFCGRRVKPPELAEALAWLAAEHAEEARRTPPPALSLFGDGISYVRFT